jgi:methenyltetrahydromethanopterin cyclohydrolase
MEGASVMNLNQRAWQRCQHVIEDAAQLRVAVEELECGTRVIDCGVRAAGGLAAGVELAEICLAGLGRVRLIPGHSGVWPGPSVQVSSDHPLAACLAAQYAGWPITGEKYFAMGSGPMRAARGREPIYDAIGLREQAACAVGVLESGKLPPAAVAERMSDECRVRPKDLILLVARTASLAGTIQVVARSVETCLHKLHEVGFDLARVHSGYGVAPLPPVAADDLTGIGRTNDAVLYGASVTLWVRGDDDAVRSIGPRVPSCSSPDHGQPFSAIFEKYDRDFYRIDPLLFSPAEVTFVNLDTGRTHCFGELRPDVLRQSLAG